MGASEEHLVRLNKIIGNLCNSLGIADGVTKLTFEQCIKKFFESGAKAGDLDSLLMAQFEMMDSDGNGEISFKEWVEYYNCHGDRHSAKHSFDAMDTNGDGIVSKEEFLAFLNEFYFSVEDKLKSSILYGPLE